MPRDPGLNTVTTASSALADVQAVPAPWDNLSAPASDDLVSAGLACWPPGAAFGSSDGQAISLSSRLANFTRVLLSPFEFLYARAFDLARECVPAFADELLVEWEGEYGLPDNCVTGATSRAERLRALEAKVASVATITPGDFIQLAASYGFEISIEEPAMFECGFSECGGEHVVGHFLQETYWIVRVTDLAVDYFRCGESECGLDPLFDLGDAQRLMCILRRAAPAWTTPILSEA